MWHLVPSWPDKLVPWFSPPFPQTHTHAHTRTNKNQHQQMEETGPSPWNGYVWWSFNSPLTSDIIWASSPSSTTIWGECPRPPIQLTKFEKVWNKTSSVNVQTSPCHYRPAYSLRQNLEDSSKIQILLPYNCIIVKIVVVIPMSHWASLATTRGIHMWVVKMLCLWNVLCCTLLGIKLPLPLEFHTTHHLCRAT